MEYVIGFVLALLMVKRPLNIKFTIKHEVDVKENPVIDLQKELADNSSSAKLDDTYEKGLTDILQNINSIMMGGDINGKE